MTARSMTFTKVSGSWAPGMPDLAREEERGHAEHVAVRAPTRSPPAPPRRRRRRRGSDSTSTGSSAALLADRDQRRAVGDVASLEQVRLEERRSTSHCRSPKPASHTSRCASKVLTRSARSSRSSRPTPAAAPVIRPITAAAASSPPNLRDVGVPDRRRLGAGPGIELERPELDLELAGVRRLLEREPELVLADVAPRADDVGVDLHEHARSVGPGTDWGVRPRR